MSWREAMSPVRMQRVALVAPSERCRDMLVAVARSGVVELDLPGARAEGGHEVDRAVGAAVVRDGVAAHVGWVPSRELPGLAGALAGCDASVVPLPHPAGVEPPTLLTGRASRTLVDTYATVPYRDVDPARLAGPAYVVMFGMMFGDVGHGAVLVVLGLLLRAKVVARLAPLARAWAFVAGAGVAAMVFGALYGEAFGPTGLIPVLWLDPLTEPIPLLGAAIGLGAALLAVSYVLGTVNRVREGGWGYALYARTGLAGTALFAAVGLLAAGLLTGHGWWVAAAAALGAAALVLVTIGLVAEAGGGVSGGVQAGVELVDTVVRLGSNIVSFARLAAFGLTHAALLTLVWEGTQGLWGPGWRAVAAVALLVVGNVVTFGLEALVAGIQALRLEYYELFSRVFTGEGRPFRPWNPEGSST
ncbi:V-type ATPase 116kDa subunit family protein [Isoptericola sp. b441]|uniref:V-type ATPase 116kDa subunit family protein n=1 Tax=Actinotalea lenta TaxID=3064654 RepID=A0ABT9D7W9_9CELL|nr:MULTISPECIES: V-type ATPase 116kDa subunit family protein [unclassified Isoptericola]MDO8106969.1 V-type ATPase 116kDa subunit family protein [Isoptericola sp. b441]MDO8121321.1 V-type ATPase 116kDa subunit family protein [Isoptericola sp. b490]